MLRLLLCVLLLAAGCNTFYDPDTAPLTPPVSGDAGDVGFVGDGSGICVGESDWVLCQQEAAQCGAISLADRCGASREIDCGECPTNAVCGAEQPNICGCVCPAEIGCLPEGAPHPDGSCRVCGDSGWEVVADAVCSDGDPCTIDDACQDDGSCAGVARDCTPDECASSGSCDPETGRCVYEPVVDGVPCTDDGLDCTEDVCVEGRCAHQRAALSCVIEAMCVAPGGDGCMVCDVQNDPFNWTVIEDGTPCLGDSGTCMAGECVN